MIRASSLSGVGELWLVDGATGTGTGFAEELAISGWIVFELLNLSGLENLLLTRTVGRADVAGAGVAVDVGSMFAADAT